MAFNFAMGKFAFTLLTMQLAMLIIFGCMVDYDDSANASHPSNQKDEENGGANPAANPSKDLYPMFQDVHVMIFIGFGFLMTFLGRYGYSAISFNMLLSALVIQWALLVSGFFDLHGGNRIKINLEAMINADFTAAAVLISFGAVLGKTSPFQLLVMAVIEVVVVKVNEYIGVTLFQAADIGGSMFVHVFGAYFGLAVARVLYRDDCENGKSGSIYHADLFSMIGTVFLWMYWPSFNAALAEGDDQHRAIINTYLAIAASCCVAIGVSVLVSKGNKINMVHVQNATLAGGVAVGTSADMMIQPWGALLIGVVAGTLSTLGYRYLTPLLSDKVKVHDTCGVNNLHGMPGLLAAIAGSVAAKLATVELYGNSLYQIFPARAPGNGTELDSVQAMFSYVDAGQGRSANVQAGYQLAALGVTLLLAIGSGIVVGLLLLLPFFDQPKGLMVFDDTPWWETPDDFTDEAEAINGDPNKSDKLLGSPTTVTGQDDSAM